MRIIHVIDSLDPVTGGPATVAARLAAAQAARGNQVTIVTTNKPRSLAAYRLEMGAIPGFERVRLIEVTGGSRHERRALHIAAGDERQPTIMHLHGVWPRILQNAASVSRSRGLPYVVVPHGMLDPWSLAQKRWKKRIGLLFGRRKLLQDASFLHMLNRDELQLLEPLGLRVKKVVLPNGMFASEVGQRAEPGAFYRRYPVLDGKPYMLFLNRLHYKKGLDHLEKILVRIAAKDPDTRLVVCGPDYGAREGFERAIMRAGLGGRVLITGPLYGVAKLEAFTDARCFCLPSRQEGFSMAIIEALSAGCPVVISENCHFPEVSAAGCGFVLPLDFDRFSSAVLTLMHDETLRVKMGVAGQELIASSYTWERIAERAESAYLASL